MSTEIPAAGQAQSSPRLILKNMASLSASGIIERMLALVAGVFARRALGPGPIGLVSWAAAIGSYPALLVNAGFGTIAKRDVARDPQRANHFVGLLLTLQLVLAVSASGLVIILAASLDRATDAKLLVALQVIGLLMLPLDLTWLLHSRERMAPLAIVTIIGACARTLLTIFVVRKPEDVFIYAVVAYPFQAALSAFQVAYAAKYGLMNWRRVRPTLQGARQLLKEALPIGLTAASATLYYNSDAVILGMTRSAQEVGLYTTAYNLMLTAIMISGAVYNTYFPSLARAASNATEAQRISSQLLHIMVWIGFSIAAFGWAIGRYPVILLYGQAFTTAGVYFEWLCLNIALMFFNIGYSVPLQAMGGQRQVFYSTLLAGIVNLLVNLWLLPIWGAPAAIATTVLSEGIVMARGFFIRRKYYPIPWFKVVFTAALTCGSAMLAGRVLADHGVWWLGGLATGATILLGIVCFEKSLLAALKRLALKKGVVA